MCITKALFRSCAVYLKTYTIQQFQMTHVPFVKALATASCATVALARAVQLCPCVNQRSCVISVEIDG